MMLASILKQRAAMHQRIVVHVLLASFRRRVGLRLSRLAGCAVPESTLPLKVIQRRERVSVAKKTSIPAFQEQPPMSRARAARLGKNQQLGAMPRVIAYWNAQWDTLACWGLALPALLALTKRNQALRCVYHARPMQAALERSLPVCAKQALHIIVVRV